MEEIAWNGKCKPGHITQLDPTITSVSEQEQISAVRGSKSFSEVPLLSVGC